MWCRVAVKAITLDKCEGAVAGGRTACTCWIFMGLITYEDGWWIDDSDNVYRGKDVTGDDIKVICWQPIPSFDEILEANRDVLERIKEKGD